MKLFRESALHEIIFGVLLAALALASRVYPRQFSEAFFHCVLFLLIFNLAYFIRSKAVRQGAVSRSLYLGVNCLAVSVLVKQSGGRDSIFWVAFLQPVMAAAVAAEGPGPWTVVAAAAALLGLMYGSPDFDVFDAGEWAVKAGTLAFAAAVAHRASRGEARLRREVDEKRRHLQMLALRMSEEAEPGPVHEDLRETIESRLRKLEAPLSLIDASVRLAELEAPDAKADLRRIEACQRLIRGLAQDLFDILYRDELWREPVSFSDLYHAALVELRSTREARDVRFEEIIPESLPKIPVSRHHFEQFLRALLERAMVDCKPGQVVRVEAGTGLEGGEPYFKASFKHPGLSDPSLVAFLRRIAERHGGWLTFRYGSDGVAYALGLPLRRGARLTPPEA